MHFTNLFSFAKLRVSKIKALKVELKFKAGLAPLWDVRCKWYKISQNKPFFFFHFFSVSDFGDKSPMFNEVKRLDWTGKS